MCDENHSAGRWRDRHPELWASDERPWSLIVANEPFSFVPHNQARKGLRDQLLVSTHPSSPTYENAVVIPRRRRDGLPTTCHLAISADTDFSRGSPSNQLHRSLFRRRSYRSFAASRRSQEAYATAKSAPDTGNMRVLSKKSSEPSLSIT
jgi:hypothetical protein